jgi:hypothetical protein
MRHRRFLPRRLPEGDEMEAVAVRVIGGACSRNNLIIGLRTMLRNGMASTGLAWPFLAGSRKKARWSVPVLGRLQGFPANSGPAVR